MIEPGLYWDNRRFGCHLAASGAGSSAGDFVGKAQVTEYRAKHAESLAKTESNRARTTLVAKARYGITNRQRLPVFNGVAECQDLSIEIR